MTSDRRTRKKEAVRRRMLDEAFKLFARDGLYAPKIEDITEAADIGKGTFYLYFPSRDALIAALVREGMDLLAARLDGALAEEPTVNRLVSAHVAFFGEYPAYLLLFHQARGWLKLPSRKDTPVREEFIRYLDHLTELIGRTLCGKGLKPAARAAIARTVAGSIAGSLSFDLVAGHEPASGKELTERLQTLSGLIEAASLASVGPPPDPRPRRSNSGRDSAPPA